MAEKSPIDVANRQTSLLNYEAKERAEDGFLIMVFQFEVQLVSVASA
jgi:hypothetical protein